MARLVAAVVVVVVAGDIGGGRSTKLRRQVLTISSPNNVPNASTLCNGGGRNELVSFDAAIAAAAAAAIAPLPPIPPPLVLLPVVMADRAAVDDLLESLEELLKSCGVLGVEAGRLLIVAGDLVLRRLLLLKLLVCDAFRVRGPVMESYRIQYATQNIWSGGR